MKESESFPHVRQLQKSEELIVRPFLPGRQLTEAERTRLRELAALPDAEIDTDDIPELPEESWNDAVRNPYLRLAGQSRLKAS